MSGSLAYLLLMIGLALGATRPGRGFALLVAVVAVTPTLPWQIGLANLAYPLAYVLGLIVGSVFGGVAVFRPWRQSESQGELGWLVLALAATITIPTVRSLIVNGPIGMPGFWAESGNALTSLATFNPHRLGGVLQAMAIALAGLLVFNIARQVLDSPKARQLFESAAVLGAGLALAAPPLQLALLDPTVRPDKGIYESAGWVGWFQDPHSFAAYLVLLTPVLLGIGAARRLRGESARSWAPPLVLAATAFVAIMMTSSRAGFGSWLGAIALFAVGTLVPVPLTNLPDGGRRARRVAVGTAAALVGAAALLWTSPGVRAPVHDFLSSVSSPRLWEFLDPDGPENPLLGRRLLMWSKAQTLIEQHPLWGVGAQGFVDTSVELSEDVMGRYAAAHGDEELRLALIEYPVEQAHNYYLQFAAEFGIPGLLAFVALIGALALDVMRRWSRLTMQQRLRVAGAASGITGVLVLSIVSHPLLLTEIAVLFWGVAGYMLRVGDGRLPEAL